MFVSLVYLLFRRALAVAALRVRSRESRSLCFDTSWRFFAARSLVLV
jgi:hypothetical protein